MRKREKKDKRRRKRERKEKRMGEEVAKTTVGTRGVRVEYCYGRG